MATKNTLRLYIDADGRPVVRTFNEIGTASEESAAKIDKSSEASTVGLEKMEKGTNRLRGAVGSLAGTIGITGLAFGIKDIIDAGEKWQLQQAQLTNALKNTGQYSKRTFNEIVASSEKLSVHGGFAGPAELTAMNQFIRLTGSASEAIKLNQAATDLARGTTLGYARAQQMIGQVLTGNTGRLQRYLGIIEPVRKAVFALTQAHGFNLVKLQAESKAYGRLGSVWLTNQEVLHNITPAEMQHAQLLDRQATATEALRRIQEKYGNSTKVFSRSTAGAISNLSDRFDLLGKTVGKDVLPIVTAIVTFMSGHTGVIFGVAAAVTALTVAWGINAALTTAIIGEWSIAKVVGTALKATMQTLGISTTAAGDEAEVAGVQFAGMWTAATLGIALLIPAIVEVATHFSFVKKVAGVVFDWLRGAVSTVVNFVGKTFHNLISGPWALALPFIGLPIYVATHFNQVKRLASQVVGFLGGIFGTVFHIVAWPFQKAWQIIKTIFGYIRAGLKTVLGPIGGLLHTLGGISGSVGNFLAHPFGLRHGGIVHAATGGIFGGYGGGDRIPALLEAGEGVLRKEAVSGIGNQAFNAINTTGTLPPGAMGSDEVYVTAPIQVQMGSRVVAEVVAHVVARRGALAGNYVSG